jgi:hypothetical protein
MTRNRIIFYSIFGVYQLLGFVFTLIIESSASVLFSMVNYLAWFKYITFLGFLMIVTDFIWMWMDHRRFRKSEDASRHENNTLKAKVYDLQEGTNPKSKEAANVSPGAPKVN